MNLANNLRIRQSSNLKKGDPNIPANSQIKINEIKTTIEQPSVNICLQTGFKTKSNGRLGLVYINN